MIRVEDYPGERLVADALPQHNPTIQRYLRRLVPSQGDGALVSPFLTATELCTSCTCTCVCVCACVCVCVCVSPFQQYKEDLLVGAKIFNSGAPRPDLPPQDVVKDLTHILLPLKTQTHMKLDEYALFHCFMMYFRQFLVLLLSCILTAVLFYGSMSLI